MPTQSARKPRKTTARRAGTAQRQRTGTKAASRTASTAVRRRSAAAPQTARRPAQRKQPSTWSYGLLSDYKRKWDTPLFMVTLMLLGCGLIALMSASYPTGYYSTDGKGPMFYILHQGGFALLGVLLMLFLSAFDYHRYHVLGKGLYLASVIALILVLTPLGSSLNGSQRWLFGFQPSEFAKLAVILTFSSFVSLNPRRIQKIRGLVPYGLALCLLILLLAMEPHMSASLILVVIGVSILFVGGMQIWYFIPVGVLGFVGGVGAYLTMPHVQKRLQVFLDPFSASQGDGWQASQSLIAIGSGGLFGLGLGDSRQKFMYLPEPMNDFIFSVVCEELGFIGATLILIMFAYFIYRGYSIAFRAEDRFGCLMAVGITTHFAFQILLNLMVVSGLFPVTGVSLPLFSYGGTALVMQLIEIGILLNISRHIPPSRKE
ncbi:MAG: putative peptidoglycan glycosyltransferase FtsW [Eubacteriales bacterium]|nr:putative peptidoglycan glycosyltransferase FtsW [Eubacteriales bacterium]